MAEGLPYMIILISSLTIHIYYNPIGSRLNFPLLRADYPKPDFVKIGVVVGF